MRFSWVRVVEASFTMLNFLVFAWYTISVLSWITGVDILKAITEIPPIEFEKIVQQYPGIFYILSLSTVTLLWIDYFAVNVFYRKRGMPPPRYILVSSLTLFSLSLTQYIFLRTTQLAWYYVYFMIIAALASIHSVMILSGHLKEILPPPSSEALPVFEELLNQTWGSEELYPLERVEARRRVLRTC